uniref:Reverse transcriptase Ty1/copia-type domain-containing protein n=1 Tax=Tanacetum cinerariifolium TaxID=118510 RepID=A0A6L2MVP4_TANCI|nr:hypothetical protein [Tanacetum cinerariifolium]
MVVSAKLPMLNLNEFDLWKMRIEQYFLMTDYALWEVIFNGDSPPPTRSVNGVEKPYYPTTVEEKLAKKNELKARGTLLMALPNEHQLKFNSYKTAESLMKAIEKRFGDLETLSMDDLYNNLKIYEAEVMGSSNTTQNIQNVAFVSSNNTDSTNKAVNIAHGVSAASSKTNASNLPNVDSLRDGLKVADGNVDYKSQKIPTENKKESRECNAFKHQDNRNREAPRRTVLVEDNTSNALVSLYDGLGYNWSDQAKDGPTNFALMAYTSSSSSSFENSDIKGTSCPLNLIWYLLMSILLVKTSERKIKTVSAPIIKDWVSGSKDEDEIKTKSKQIKPSFAKIKFVKSTEHVKSPKKSAKQTSSRVAVSVNTVRPINTTYPRLIMNGQFTTRVAGEGVIDSGCFRYKTGNMSYLSKYKEIDGGYVAFGGDPKGGKIIDTECVVLSLNFKLLDECQVLLRVPRKNNMYIIDLRNVAPSGGLKDEIVDVAGKKCTKVPRNENEVQDPVKEGDNNDQEKDVKIKKRPLENNLNKNLKDCLVKGRLLTLTDLILQDKDANRNKMFTPASTDGSTYVYLGGSILVNAATLPNVDLPIDPLMPDLKDIANLQDTRIFRGAYDDEVKGEKADFNNLELTTVVSPIPTTKIHKDHPKEQIIGDTLSALQTRRMTKTSQEHAMVSYIKKKRRTNHKDYQNCLLACFLSQIEPKKVIQALQDPSWIEAMQDELLQFKLQKVFAPVAKIEAIRLFLAYASFMEFIVYQMDVKSAFMYGTIEEEVYVCQPLSFEDPHFPNKVYKVEKALYGLHQAPRAWYKTLSTYLLENGFRRRIIDKTLFIKKDKGDILINEHEVSDEFYGGAHFRLRVASHVETASTLIETNKALLKDEEAVDVDVHLYRSMIRSLMYLIASRPDIMFVVYACARFQVTPKVSHLHAVKRIFKYLKDSDYARASLDRKSTIGGCQFLRKILISWQCKKQTVVANSTTEAEYVVAASCCGQVS